jgi:hypothetical protein
VWRVGYIVVGFVGGGKVGAAVWGLLHEYSSESYAQYLSQLQQDIADGIADPKIVEKIAVISGAIDEYSTIRGVVDSMQSNELFSRLTELAKMRERMKKTMGEKSPVGRLVWGSVSYQIGYYYAMTIIDLNIMAICDRLKGIDPSVPSVSMVNPTLPPPTDPKLVLPPGTVLDRFENPPKSKVIPTLIAIATLASFLL